MCLVVSSASNRSRLALHADPGRRGMQFCLLPTGGHRVTSILLRICILWCHVPVCVERLHASARSYLSHGLTLSGMNAAERDSANPSLIGLSAAAELVGAVSAALERGCSGTPVWPARWDMHDLLAQLWHSMRSYQARSVHCACSLLMQVLMQSLSQ